MINSANNKLIKNINTNLPNMSSTIVGWFLDLTFETVERDLIGADWTETVTGQIKTKGVVQPPKDKDLMIYPEGSWAWEWLLIHCLPDTTLDVNQYIKYDGKTYKVMAKKDWTKYGYVRYTILEAYQADNL